MGATYIPDCEDDSWIPVRATHKNLYKWPESDVKFVRSVSGNGRGTNIDPSTLRRTLTTNGRLDGASVQPKFVNSMSCRQIYLRSYTFSRKESMPQKARTCAARIKQIVFLRGQNRKLAGGAYGSIVLVKRTKEIFLRLLSCTTKSDVGG